MKRVISLLACVLFSGMLIVLGGCWSDDTSGTGTISTPVEQTNPQSVYDTDPQSRVNYITSHLAIYTDQAKHLPGSTEFLQRISLGNVFDDLSDLLPKLAGPNPSAIFRQQLHIVQGTHPQLNALALDVSSDTVVEAGLRGASEALEDLSTSLFADQTDLATAINNLNTKLDELETSPPETHRQVVADAADMIGQIMRSMDTVLTERLQPATTMPTTVPTQQVLSTQPATNPS